MALMIAVARCGWRSLVRIFRVFMVVAVRSCGERGAEPIRPGELHRGGDCEHSRRRLTTVLEQPDARRVRSWPTAARPGSAHWAAPTGLWLEALARLDTKDFAEFAQDAAWRLRWRGSSS